MVTHSMCLETGETSGDKKICLPKYEMSVMACQCHRLRNGAGYDSGWRDVTLRIMASLNVIVFASSFGSTRLPLYMSAWPWMFVTVSM